MATTTHFGLNDRAWCGGSGEHTLTTKVAEVTCKNCLRRQIAVPLAQLSDVVARGVMRVEIDRREAIEKWVEEDAERQRVRQAQLAGGVQKP